MNVILYKLSFKTELIFSKTIAQVFLRQIQINTQNVWKPDLSPKLASISVALDLLVQDKISFS